MVFRLIGRSVRGRLLRGIGVNVVLIFLCMYSFCVCRVCENVCLPRLCYFMYSGVLCLYIFF